MASATKLSENTQPSSLNWCVPLLNDAIGHEYISIFQAKSSAYASLTMLHARVWTKLIEHDKAAAFMARRQLLEFAYKAGLSTEHIEYIDSVLFDGINAVVSRKPRRIGSGRDERTAALYEIAITIGEFRVMLKQLEPNLSASNAFQRILNSNLSQ